MWQTRAQPNTGDAVVTPVHHLSTQQRIVLLAISDYQRLTGEACSASYLGRRLRLHHSTIQDHLSALYRKGWLRTPNTPAILRQTLE